MLLAEVYNFTYRLRMQFLLLLFFLTLAHFVQGPLLFKVFSYCVQLRTLESVFIVTKNVNLPPDQLLFLMCA